MLFFIWLILLLIIFSILYFAYSKRDSLNIYPFWVSLLVSIIITLTNTDSDIINKENALKHYLIIALIVPLMEEIIKFRLATKYSSTHTSEKIKGIGLSFAIFELFISKFQIILSVIFLPFFVSLGKSHDIKIICIMLYGSVIASVFHYISTISYSTKGTRLIFLLTNLVCHFSINIVAVKSGLGEFSPIGAVTYTTLIVLIMAFVTWLFTNRFKVGNSN